jgi:hypothetical protein
VYGRLGKEGTPHGRASVSEGSLFWLSWCGAVGNGGLTHAGRHRASLDRRRPGGAGPARNSCPGTPLTAAAHGWIVTSELAPRSTRRKASGGVISLGGRYRADRASREAGRGLCGRTESLPLGERGVRTFRLDRRDIECPVARPNLPPPALVRRLFASNPVTASRWCLPPRYYIASYVPCHYLELYQWLV